jgi:hypothetical protein
MPITSNMPQFKNRLKRDAMLFNTGVAGGMADVVNLGMLNTDRDQFIHSVKGQSYNEWQNVPGATIKNRKKRTVWHHSKLVARTGETLRAFRYLNFTQAGSEFFARGEKSQSSVKNQSGRFRLEVNFPGTVGDRLSILANRRGTVNVGTEGEPVNRQKRRDVFRAGLKKALRDMNNAIKKGIRKRLGAI